jgi:hypothetical protein
VQSISSIDSASLLQQLGLAYSDEELHTLSARRDTGSADAQTESMKIAAMVEKSILVLVRLTL